MNISVERLETQADLLACERLQAELLGDKARSVLCLPALTRILESGGLVLGAWASEGSSRRLCGALVDLHAVADGYPARLTAFLGVELESRNQGIAQSLRQAERTLCHESGVDLVFWWSDPLESIESHIAVNRLGAIATAHIRNALGPLNDRVNAGLPTDRLRVEWWIDSPRAQAVLDNAAQPAHYHIGLDQMHVMTRSHGQQDADRTPTGMDDAPPKERYVLVEIPDDFARVRLADPETATAWRLQTRQAFELLFDLGYTMVGLIRGGRRSFQLLEKADRGSVLGRF